MFNYIQLLIKNLFIVNIVTCVCVYVCVRVCCGVSVRARARACECVCGGGVRPSRLPHWWTSRIWFEKKSAIFSTIL